MPVGQQFDVILRSKGYMLARNLPGGGRAWSRTGQPDSPARRSAQDTKYGNVPDELDHPEVFNDWSGGYGDAYRQPDRLNTYHWSENFDPRWPGQLVHAQNPLLMSSMPAVSASNAVCANYFLDAPPHNAADIGRLGAGDVVAIGAKYVISWTAMSANGTIDGVTVTGAGGGDQQAYGNRPALFGSYYILPILSGSRWQAVGIPNGAIEGANDWPRPGNAFTTAGNRLWKAGGPLNTGVYLQSCAAGTDPTVTANWSATLPVGDRVNTINDLVSLGDQVFAGAPNGLYAGDQSGTFVNILSEVANQRHVDNCRDLAIYNGQVHAQTIGGVWAVAPAMNNVSRAEVREVGPSPLSNRGPVRGYVRALRAHGAWLYGGLWTGSQSYLLAGIDASPGLPYVWHTMQRLPHVAKVHRLHIDGITLSSGGQFQVPNRMWVATDASIATGGTAPTYLWPIPAQNGNPLATDPAFLPNYVGSARMDFPATNWQAPATPKILRDVEVWSENLATGAQYVDVYYAVDNGARTLLGRAQTSPLTTLYFPTETTGSFVQGQSIALSIESFTASANVTPVYRSFVLRGLLNPKSVDTVAAVLRIADDVPNRTGVPMRPGATMLAELRALAGGPPCQMVDLTGATHWVKVLQPVEEREVYQAGSDYPEIAATVKLAILTFS